MGLFDFLNKRKVADVFLDLRNQVISLDPSKIGLKPDESNPIFGILMETGYKDAVVSLSAIGDGTVSLYFSNGGGIIGLGQHEKPRIACLSFLSFAKEYISHLESVTDFPLPRKGQTIFYFLTVNGTLRYEAKEDDLGNGRLPLSPLFQKAHEVITEARLVDEKQKKDFSELMNATTTGDTDKIELLIKSGVNINESDETGLNPFMVAAYSGKVDVLKQLFEAEVPIDIKDSSGYTALMFASNSNQLSCVKYLVENGANINEIDKEGSTPLMFCAQHGYNDIVKYLLTSGADPCIKGNHGLDAIGFAEQNQLVETKKILLNEK